MLAVSYAVSECISTHAHIGRERERARIAIERGFVSSARQRARSILSISWSLKVDRPAFAVVLHISAREGSAGQRSRKHGVTHWQAGSHCCWLSVVEPEPSNAAKVGGKSDRPILSLPLVALLTEVTSCGYVLRHLLVGQ